LRRNFNIWWYFGPNHQILTGKVRYIPWPHVHVWYVCSLLCSTLTCYNSYLAIQHTVIYYYTISKTLKHYFQNAISRSTDERKHPRPHSKPT